MEQAENDTIQSETEIPEKQSAVEVPIRAIGSLIFDTTSRIYTDLSNKFNFQSRIQSYSIKHGDSSIVDFYIFNKKTDEIVQEISIQSNFLYFDGVYSSDDVRSYITGINAKSQIVDNDYGDIIIADFNFDGLEDLALKSDQGGNGGPIYNYHLQSYSRQFKMDSFLTDSMSYFPETFDKKGKSLITLVHANVMQDCATTFTYNSSSRTWKRTHSELVGY